MKELFEKYALLTRNIMSGIQLNIPVDEFFEKREEVIKEIVESDLSSSEKKMMYSEMKLDKLDNDLKKLIQSEMIKAKSEMNKLKMGKQMHRVYSGNVAPGNYFGGRA